MANRNRRGPSAKGGKRAADLPGEELGTAGKPTVLFIDDNADVLKRTLGLAVKDILNAHFLGPSDLQDSILWSASLVMVDYDLADWLDTQPSGDRAGFSLDKPPQDGLALIGSFRSLSERNPQRKPTAYAVFTGDERKLPGGAGDPGRNHLLAEAFGVEWVFGKRESLLGQRILSLANATSTLPTSWPSSLSQLYPILWEELLRVPSDASWRATAIDEVLQSEPPLSAVSQATHGLGLVRWMLHRILPYPTFLLNVRHVAARLRVSVGSLSEAIASNSPIRDLLHESQYEGMLAGFAGDRWWRAGVEETIWKLAESGDPKTLHESVLGIEPGLEPVEVVQPVVTLSSSYCESDELRSVEEVVEVAPEGWPSYADPAWVLTECAAEDPELRARVVPRDRERVPTTNDSLVRA